MSWWDDERPKPRRPANGIKAKTQRGKFGTNWWATRWLAALEQLVDSGRLQRGRTYARQGQVLNIDIAPGRVASKVQGSSPRPYTVRIDITPLDDAAWAQVIAAMAAQAIFAAKLLVGEMPQHIEEAFATAHTSLFPTKRGDLSTHCSCPDAANPCKHIAAVCYLLGEQFDDDPFLMFQLRGRSRDAIIAALHQQRTGSAVAASTALEPPELSVPLDAQLATFWQLAEPAAFAALHFPITAPLIMAAPLKVLGAPPFWPDRDSFVRAFQPCYAAVTSAALAAAEE